MMGVDSFVQWQWHAHAHVPVAQRQRVVAFVRIHSICIRVGARKQKGLAP